VNKEIMKAMGFEREVRMAEEGLCPFCGKEVNIDDFRDKISLKDFGVTGLCQGCQDKTYGEEEE